jgi:hypothetical protein
MKNKFLELNQEQRTPLCKLGLNVAYLRTNKINNHYVDISDIIKELNTIKAVVKGNDVFNLNDLIHSKTIKNATIFKNVYFYNTNFDMYRLKRCLSNEENKQIVIGRLDLIIYQLQTY